MKHLVVGLGSIGRRHLDNLLAVCPAGEVRGVEPAAGPARAAAELGLQVWPDLDSGLKWRPDLIWICTPHRFHVPAALAALEAGAHLFLEKPIAPSLAEARPLLAAARRAGRMVWAACNLRYHPGPAAIKSGLEAGLIGRPFLVKAHYAYSMALWRPGRDYRATYSARAAEGGGILLDAIHELDLLLWLAGPAAGAAGLVRHTGLLETDVEELAGALVEHESGLVSFLHLDALRQDRSRGLEVEGASGSLIWRSRGKGREGIEVLRADSRGRESLFEAPDFEVNLMFQRQRDEVLARVEQGRADLASLEDGLRALALAEAIRRSSREGRRVEVEPAGPAGSV